MTSRGQVGAPPHTLPTVLESDSLLGDERLEMMVQEEAEKDKDDPVTKEMLEILKKRKCRESTEKYARWFLIVVVVSAVVAVYLRLFILH